MRADSLLLVRVAAVHLVLGAGLAHAAPGDLDVTFGSGGYDTTQLPGACVTAAVCWIKASSVAVQPDGRVVVAANFRHRTGDLSSDNQIVLYRRLPGGGPDPAFGEGGMAIPFPVGCAGPIALQPDGKIVAGVSFSTFYGSCFTDLSVQQAFRLARFGPDGAPDPTFGSSGTAMIDAGVHAVALQADGRIVALTRGEGGTSGRAFLKRFNADGTPDLSFGAGGSADLGIDPPEYIANDFLPYTESYSLALALQADDRPVVAATSGGRIVLVRLSRDGMPDGTFNGSDRVVLEKGTALALSEYVGNGVLALQSTGRIIVSGAVGQAPFLFAFGSDGTPDPGFGVNGRVPLSASASAPAVPGAVAVQANDRIVVAGYYHVERRTAAGWRDATFRQSVSPTLARVRIAAQGDNILTVAHYYASPAIQIRRHEAGDRYDVFSDARFFAMAQYRDFLDREGDTGGIDYWSSEIASGARSRGQVVDSFFTSPEFQGTVAPVARLYFAYFLRIPDYGGLNFWVGQFRAGNSVEAISNQFAASPEFANRYGALTNAQFVSLVYQNVLGRAPDAPGLAYWTGRVDAGMTRGQMMMAFSESPEYRATIGSEVYVVMMYMGMLRREPDAGGFNFWTDFMDAGRSRIELVDGFLSSIEYRRRFLQ